MMYPVDTSYYTSYYSTHSCGSHGWVSPNSHDEVSEPSELGSLDRLCEVITNEVISRAIFHRHLVACAIVCYKEVSYFNMLHVLCT